jgi:carboxypeptidase C (cathepsin A)
MSKRAGFILILAAILLCSSISALSQRPQQRQPPPPAGEPPSGEQARRPAPPPEDKISKTQHTLRIGGQEIKYTATAGTMVLKTEEDQAKATVFYIAYTKDDVADRGQRPVCFTFNGGPGSSSVWLHLGAFGPRRVEMGDADKLLAPPWKLVDNESSLLDVTDMVFIDPVTTGYSRPAPGEAPRQFHGLQEDTQWVGDFIRLWTTRNERWLSPKFLAGESYGTTRAASLSGYLQQRHGMFLNGIILISSILNFQTARFDTGNDLPYIVFLPTYTATAWYHKKLPQDLQGDLQKALRESREFAAGEYTRALGMGGQLPPAERAKVVQKLARLTGLSTAYLEQTNLRINIQRFCKELLRSERRTVGRLDSRFKGMDLDAAGERGEYDPSMAAITGPYTATLNDYVRRVLKFESDLPYEILTSRVQPWSYGQFENRYVNVAETLRSAMTQNPDLRVFVGNGYYDLATPFHATEYTFDHLGLDPSLAQHVTLTYYEAGHMMYVHMPSLAQLKKDVAVFIQSATKR